MSTDEIDTIQQILKNKKKNTAARQHKKDLIHLWQQLLLSDESEARQLFRKSNKLVKRNTPLPTFRPYKQFDDIELIDPKTGLYYTFNQNLKNNNIRTSKIYNEDLAEFYRYLSHFGNYYPFYRQIDKDAIELYCDGHKIREIHYMINQEYQLQYNISYYVNRIYRYINIAKMWYLNRHINLDESRPTDTVDDIIKYEIALLKEYAKKNKRIKKGKNNVRRK